MPPTTAPARSGTLPSTPVSMTATFTPAPLRGLPGLGEAVVVQPVLEVAHLVGVGDGRGGDGEDQPGEDGRDGARPAASCDGPARGVLPAAHPAA